METCVLMSCLCQSGAFGGFEMWFIWWQRCFMPSRIPAHCGSRKSIVSERELFFSFYLCYCFLFSCMLFCIPMPFLWRVFITLMPNAKHCSVPCWKGCTHILTVLTKLSVYVDSIPWNCNCFIYYSLSHFCSLVPGIMVIVFNSCYIAVL